MVCRRFFLLGLLLAVLAAVPVLHGGDKKGTHYAILISVSKYARTDQWRTLKYSIDEMEEFRSILTKTGFVADNIVFLHDRQTDEKLRPTGVNIFKKLDLLLQEIGPDDTLLVAFNGHGVQFGGDMTGYFAPVNADLKDKKTLVAMDGKDGLYSRLEQCKARKKLLIVNACRSEPTVDFALATQKYDLVDKEDRDPPKGTAALFSCKPGQKSYEYPPEQNRKRTFFFHHLIEAWQGKYAEGEKVSLDHVFDVVTRKTAADARNIFSEAQTPWPRRKYEGEWVLAARALTITNSIGMKLTYIPPGKFQMGSPKSEQDYLLQQFRLDHAAQEKQHEVELAKGFYMGVYAVTQEEYESVMGKNPSWFSGQGGGKNVVAGMDTRRFPVESVSWNDTKEFCRKLSAKEGKSYRLPSEAEWEYACRAGTTTPFHFGETISTDHANYNGQVYGNGKQGEISVRTTKVGSFAPNAWGLYDMHGNVWQWCEDWYDAKYYENSPKTNPLNENKGQFRVLRGGSWSGTPWECRSASRNDNPPEQRDFIFGFRVVFVSP